MTSRGVPKKELQSGKVLSAGFFDRPTLDVTRELLGKTLCRWTGKEVLRLQVTEVEAYDGPEDKACHAYRGPTKRNSVLFGPPGYWYVYLCYGVHWLLNIVTGPEDYPSAVLLRGAGEFVGPGRLTKGIRVDKQFDRKAATEKTGLWFEEGEIVVPEHEVERTPRIGVDYAGPVWAKKPYRMVWKASLRLETRNPKS